MKKKNKNTKKIIWAKNDPMPRKVGNENQNNNAQ